MCQNIYFLSFVIHLSTYLCVYIEYQNRAHRHAISIDKQNGLTEELSDFQRGTVIGCYLFYNKSVHKMAALVNCKCSSCEVEMSRSNNGSAVKWYVTQAHRTGPPSAEAHST